MTETLLAPLISATILGVLALVGVIAQARNASRGNRETRMPTLGEAWQAADAARTLRIRVEDWALDIRSAARSYMTRGIAAGVPPTPEELQALETDPPTERENTP